MKRSNKILFFGLSVLICLTFAHGQNATVAEKGKAYSSSALLAYGVDLMFIGGNAGKEIDYFNKLGEVLKGHHLGQYSWAEWAGKATVSDCMEALVASNAQSARIEAALETSERILPLVVAVAEACLSNVVVCRMAITMGISLVASLF